MGREKGSGNAGKDDAGQDGDGQDILLDLLFPRGLWGAEDDALDLVVYAPTCLEGIGGGCGGEVAEIGLEEPESLSKLHIQLSD